VRHRVQGDDGAATTALVLILPTVLLMVMLVVQFALAFHARQVLTQAAQDAAFAGSAHNATADTASTVADRVIGAAGNGLVHDVTVTVTDTAASVHVTIDATVVSVVPGFALHVDGDAESPTETFRPQAPG
jgi:Flp pilus assembly protein TadG